MEWVLVQEAWVAQRQVLLQLWPLLRGASSQPLAPQFFLKAS